MKVCYEPIGEMHCDVKEPVSAPRFYSASDVKGVIEIYEPFLDGMDSLEEYDQIVVLFHFHLSRGYVLKQKSPSGRTKGVFSLCSPMRPNAIGMSILKLVRVEPPFLHVEHVDLVDGTPILDIKPFKPPEGT
ncbi:MAG TPA: tRNA (N6-threonylcarbamoyladenosine(37)-N6)-methyltransferase TrmO [Deltaproteobacteria bacterium]|jgi:tRNA-Thr(GGU) m(6)t(6)A37 methyltransferase TsaA|nr:tRNA (N6-threonylcarbamoyladenosine(37)-N6)-methyltransferase TrmO [Deltaproteobacteria bacterium]MDI9541922.1 tRNA (N6-threonylcarbamoyladenosine(37)-N6)-methyltransferase TrmO [Pseudomonadota bacterium]HNU73691.1 tRNA (N6-threonylcarbamoyladenosine(37)-N6)-methyltransferase TrmO [Deltaproteobacteria bacterium]HOD72284.1 tRNA (N6-threonylcarbamoyladenosine(37)-N6)-methyltransferase TrmO [Deltaproteobacteria bacterium]HON60890.1 tRNA (N6-threonylcarbamoyladenosine(37)-N6)-methyltransferase T